MKRILPFLFLLCGFALHAQNKVAQQVKELQKSQAVFRPVSVLAVSGQEPDAEIDKVVGNATLATLKLEKVAEVVANQYEYIALEIPYQNQTLTVLLYKVNPFAEGFHVDTDKAANIPYQKGVYYRGILSGDYGSVGSFNFFNGQVSGIISSDTLGNLVLGKLDRPNNLTGYIVYSDAEMKVLNGFDCQFKDDEIPAPDPAQPNNRNIESIRCVSMYFEIDNDIYLSNGSDTTATTNWMTAVFNNMQTLYTNDGISVGLKSVYIWTDPDPYDGIGTTSGAYLNLFHETRPIFDGDVGQLIGIDPGGLGGLAVTINGLCNANNYCYSDVNFSYATVPTYSWTINVITHEFGHLLGSRHTHSCAWNGNNTAIDGCGQQAGFSEGSCAVGPIPSSTVKGTIMSYCHLISGVGINFNNGFGPQPAAVIINRVDSAACLSTDCINTCINMVSEITVTAVSTNSVSFSWTDENPAQNAWQVSVTPFGSSAITWFDVTATPNYTLNGLNPNTYYVIRVRPLCTTGGAIATGRDQIFATDAVDFCANTPFTDTGGASSNYTNNQLWTRTMLPSNPGLKIRVTFTSFNLEADYDYLYIYNGPNEFFPDLTLGGLTGTTLPPPFNSTDASGALTFKFYSDQGVVASGWNATISCTGTLGLAGNDFIDFSYAPNPTNGEVAITSKTPMSEVTVYNVTGQLLYKSSLQGFDANVNLSAFAVGTYFFKLRFEGGHEVNFKIQRN